MRTITFKIDGDTKPIDAKLAETIARLQKGINSVKFPSDGSSPSSPRSSPKPSTGRDYAMERALKDIENYKRSSQKMESDLTANVSKQAELQFQARQKQWQKGVNEYQKTLKQYKEIPATRGTFFDTGAFKNAALGSFTGNLAASAVSEAVSIAKQGGAAWLDYASKIEQARIGMDTLTGSAAAADKHIKDLQAFAAKTPFKFEGLLDSSQLLQGVGIKAERVIPILTDVGNALAASGKGNAEIERTVIALSQITSKGKLMAQEVNQLAESGIPSWKILSTELGKSSAEVMKLAENGQISSEVFLEALHRYSQANFGDQMEKQSKTFAGAWSNIEDTLLASSEKAFAPFYSQISDLSVRFADDVGRQGEDFRGVGNVIGQYIAEGVGTGLGNIVNLIGSYAGGRLKDISEGKIADPLFTSTLSGLVKGFSDSISGTGAERDRLNKEFRQNLAETQKKEAEAEKAKKLKEKSAIVLPRTFEQQSKELKAVAQFRLDTIEQSYKIESALLNSHLLNTTNEQIKNASDLANLKSASLREQIDLQGKLFDQQIALYNKEKKDSTDVVKERNKALGNLNAELIINELNTLKQVRELRKQGNDQLRNDMVSFKGLQIDETQSVYDDAISGTQRNIGGSVRLTDGFERLIKLNQSAYEQISQITKEQYDLQLENQNLTAQQRINLEKQMYLALQKLARDNKQAILKIQDEQLQALLQKTASLSDSLSSFAEAQRETENSVFDLLLGGGSNSSSRVGSLLNQLEGRQSVLTDGLQKEYEQALKDREDFSTKFRDITARFDSRKTTAQDTAKQLQELSGLPVTAIEDFKKVYETKIGELESTADNLRTAINGVENEAARLRPILADAQGAINDLFANGFTADAVDKIPAELIKRRYAGALTDIGNSISEKTAGLKTLEKSQPGSPEIDKARTEIRALEYKQTKTRIDQDRELQDSYDNSNAGLRQQLELLQKGDDLTVAYINHANERRLLEARVSNITELYNKETDSLMSLERVQFEMSQKSVFSQNESDLIFLSEMNNRMKSTSQIAADFKLGIADGITSPIESLFAGVNKQIDKLPVGIRQVTGAFSNMFQSIIQQMANKFIMRLFGFDSGQSGGSSSSSGGFSNVLGSILGGRSGSFSNGTFGGTPSFAGSSNFNSVLGSIGGGSQFFNNSANGAGGGMWGGWLDIANQKKALGNSNGSLLSSLLGKGGIFGSKGFGFNSGTSGILGIAATLIGSAVGGRFGRVLSAAGTGATIGTMFGGPVGALVGAGVGALIGLFSGGTRKADEKQRDSLMVETLRQLNDIKTQMQNSKSVDIDGLLSSAGAIKDNYFSVANTLKDKKTRNIAIKDGNERVTPLYNSIVEASTLARIRNARRESANELYSRITPEFATGYFNNSGYQDFKKRNGMMSGNYDRRDDIAALIGKGEMVLNPSQIARVRANAGFDAFANAGIPNYKPKIETPRFAEGVSFAAPVSVPASQNISQPEFNFIFENVQPLPDAKVYLQTGEGKKLIWSITNDGFQNGKISTNKR